MILNITNYYPYLDYDFAKNLAVELMQQLQYETIISDWQCDVKSREKRQHNQIVHHAYAYSVSADVRVYLSTNRMYCACGHNVHFYSNIPYFEVCSESPAQAVEFFISRQNHVTQAKNGYEGVPSVEQAIKAYVQLVYPWAITARIVDGTFYVYSDEPDYVPEWTEWHGKYGSMIRKVFGLAKALHLHELDEEGEKNWRMDF